jgi:hypothetical protein
MAECCYAECRGAKKTTLVLKISANKKTVSAFETFGAPGKLAVEMSMIGFMVGTCIAFFVVIGDLSPPIIASVVDIVPSENLRIVTMLGQTLFRC